ncbi:hypothetical protein BDZ91DRAFT_112784 [Kalaharituber pfeilii]|nr:hypothetical protein BDZ91DRAFT_112784 [Kalaharituber pfeilii]
MEIIFPVLSQFSWDLPSSWVFFRFSTLNPVALLLAPPLPPTAHQMGSTEWITMASDLGLFLCLIPTIRVDNLPALGHIFGTYSNIRRKGRADFGHFAKCELSIRMLAFVQFLCSWSPVSLTICFRQMFHPERTTNVAGSTISIMGQRCRGRQDLNLKPSRLGVVGQQLDILLLFLFHLISRWPH